MKKGENGRDEREESRPTAGVVPVFCSKISVGWDHSHSEAVLKKPESDPIRNRSATVPDRARTVLTYILI